jgi:hypothetical protein
MRLTQAVIRGTALVLAATVAIATFDDAHAASKKSKHPKPQTAGTTAGAPAGATSGSQPALPGLPDPGVYK